MRFQGLRFALTFFSVAPVAGPATVDRSVAGRGIALAPAVGVLLGLVAGAVLFVFRAFGGGGDLPGLQLLPPVMAVATLAVLTRGLHLDGLADTADGLGAVRSPAAAMEVMHRGNTGPLGVAAVLLVALVQISALELAVQAHRGTLSLLTGVVAGRCAVVVACSGPGAAVGSQLGALAARTVRRPVALLVVVVSAAALSLAAVLLPDAASGKTAGGSFYRRGGLGRTVAERTLLDDRVAPLIALAVALVVGGLLVRWAVHRLGGITGDVLGAALELSTAAALVVMSIRP